MSKPPSYSLTVLNDSGQNLFFTLFSYNKNTMVFSRVLNNSKAISNQTSDVFQWPVNTKTGYDPNLMFYIAANDVPINGIDVETATKALTVPLDSRNESTRVKTVKYSQFVDLA